MHVRTSSDLHRSFPRLHPKQQKITIFRVLVDVLLLRTATVAAARPILPRKAYVSLSLRVKVCHLPTRTSIRLLGPCFKTGRYRRFRPHPSCRGDRHTHAHTVTVLVVDAHHPAHTSAHRPASVHGIPRPATPRPAGQPCPWTLPSPQTIQHSKPMWTGTTHSAHPPQRAVIHAVPHSPATLPPQRFHMLLTPFARCFSSFLHSTSALSVSHLYLALDGVYHPLELQSQTTRLAISHPSQTHTVGTGVSPSLPPSSKRLPTICVPGRPCNPTTRTCARFPCCALPTSLAVTEGIPVGVFSSAY